MLSSEDSGRVVQETQSAIEFIRDNWTDEIGRQYICWLEEVHKKMKEIERRKKVIQFKVQKIFLICEDITTTATDSPKTRKKTR